MKEETMDYKKLWFDLLDECLKAARYETISLQDLLNKMVGAEVSMYRMLCGDALWAELEANSNHEEVEK